MRNPLFAAFAAVAFLSAGSVSAEILHYTAKLDGASETPPNASKGTGEADITLDSESMMLMWKVTYGGLTGPATMAHFHGPAAMGSAAGVQIPLKGSVASPISGMATLNDGQIGDLRGGLWYLNIHTSANPGGEIRGQVLAAH